MQPLYYIISSFAKAVGEKVDFRRQNLGTDPGYRCSVLVIFFSRFPSVGLCRKMLCVVCLSQCVRDNSACTVVSLRE